MRRLWFLDNGKREWGDTTERQVPKAKRQYLVEQAIFNPSMFNVEPWFLPKQYRIQTVEEVIDTAHLHQLSEGDLSFEVELLQTFVDDTEVRLPVLQQALAEEDFDVITRQAHQIRGASSGVGVPAMQALARQLEALAKEHKTMDMPEILGFMKMRLEQVKTYITKMV
jgi:HPt (histidine-containing phosphotransfer) domain-containing protein